MQQVSKQLIKGLPRRIALMLLDCGLIVLCYWLAVMLRFDSGDAYRRVEILRAMAPMLLYVLPIYMIVFWFGGENYSEKTVKAERSVSDIIYFATAIDAANTEE